MTEGRQTGSFGDELTNAAMIGLVALFGVALVLRAAGTITAWLTDTAQPEGGLAAGVGVLVHPGDPAAARDALLHTMACKAAIKGGWKSDLSELRVLVDKVQSGEVQFCPHGRPVKAKLTKYELEKMFKRA